MELEENGADQRCGAGGREVVKKGSRARKGVVLGGNGAQESGAEMESC